MNDWTLPLHLTVVAGCSGSGKSTFCEKHIRKAKGVVLTGIFDFKGEFSKRLGIRPVSNLREMEAALRTRMVIFNPHIEFPGQQEKAFAWFCKWFFEVSKRGPGRKIIYLDEVWKFCSPTSIPPALAEIVQTGRGYGIESFFSTQRPNRLNEAILNEATELVIFKLKGRNAIQTVAELGIPDNVPLKLKKGSFYALNTETDEAREGKLF